jgi:dihydroorotase
VHAPSSKQRILGHYVRDQKVLTLPDALRRVAIEPARRLEGRVPEMRERGRLRAGAFADITIFDPATVVARTTYAKAVAYSQGIVHVAVNGVPIVGGFFVGLATVRISRCLVSVRDVH